MAQRATIADLEAQVGLINRMTGSPEQPYAKDGSGQFQPQAGSYHLDGAYGGWSLDRMCQTGTGTIDVLMIGHVSKRELLTALHSFRRGIEAD